VSVGEGLRVGTRVRVGVCVSVSSGVARLVGGDVVDATAPIGIETSVRLVSGVFENTIGPLIVDVGLLDLPVHPSRVVKRIAMAINLCFCMRSYI
jgi:hypothetical protein